MIPRNLLVFLYPFISLCHATSDVSVKAHGDVFLPKVKNLNGFETILNGHGLRRFSFYGIQMDMYVAGLYSRDELLMESDVWNTDGPICIDFIFLQNVPTKRMRIAWRYQMDTSVSQRHNNYPGYEKDRETFLQLMGSINKLGMQSIQIIGNETMVVENGTIKGSVKGTNFQKAFLSMWFGEKPVTPELKLNLLNGRNNLVCS